MDRLVMGYRRGHQLSTLSYMYLHFTALDVFVLLQQKGKCTCGFRESCSLMYAMGMGQRDMSFYCLTWSHNKQAEMHVAASDVRPTHGEGLVFAHVDELCICSSQASAYIAGF